MPLVDWASVIVALGLFIVTAVYTYFTAAQFKPYLKASIDFESLDQMYFIIQNTGKGAAHEVEAEWEVQRLDSEKRTWEIPLVEPGESHRFAIPLGPRNQKYVDVQKIDRMLSGNNGRIKFFIKCSDILGRTHRDCQYVDISKSLDRIDSASEMPKKESLEKISDSLEQIDQQMSNSE